MPDEKRVQTFEGAEKRFFRAGRQLSEFEVIALESAKRARKKQLAIQKLQSPLQEEKEPSFFTELFRELTGPIRRTGTVLSGLGRFISERTDPLRDLDLSPFPVEAKKSEAELSREFTEAAGGLALDVGLFAATGGVGRGVAAGAGIAGRSTAFRALTTGTIKTLRRTGAGRKFASTFLRPEFAQQAGRSALSLARFRALTPSDEEAADAGARVESIFRDAGIGAAFPVFGKLLAPVGRAVQGRVAKLFERVRGPKEVGDALEKATKAFEKTFLTRFSRFTPREITQNELPKIVEAAGVLGQEAKNIFPTQAVRAGQLVEAESVLATGTIAKEAKPLARELAREIGRETDVVSVKQVRGLQYAIASLDGALRAARTRFEELGEKEASIQILNYEALLGNAKAIFLKKRRAFGKVGQQLQKASIPEMVSAFQSELQRISAGLGDVVLTKENVTGFQEFVSLLKQGKLVGASGLFIRDVWRKNLFPIFSFIADTVGNTGKVGQAALEGGAVDIFDFIRFGQRPTRLPALANAIFRGNPFGKKIDNLLSPTALGIRFRPFFNQKIDRILFPGAALKQGTDSAFKRIGFLSSLYEGAIKEGRQKGITGVELTSFVRGKVLNPTKEALDQATEKALKFGFAEPIPRSVQRFASNPAVQLLISPFLSFQYRFARWLAEFTPLSPTFLSKVSKGTATTEDFITFAVRNATGIGGVQLVNDTIYDSIDFETFEYVSPETGRRISLGAISPLAEAVAIAGLFRKDWGNAVRAIQRSSLTLPGMGGLLSEIVSNLDQVKPGQKTFPALERQFDRMLTTLIPGQQLFKGIASIFDPIQREGVLGQFIPSVGEPRISGTTGEPRRIERRILGTDIPAPAALGSRLTERIPDIVETEIRRLRKDGFGISLRVPKVALRGLAKNEPPPDDIQQFFERVRGTLIKTLLGSIINTPGYGNLTNTQKEKVLQDFKSQATRIATQQAQVRFLTSRLRTPESAQ